MGERGAYYNEFDPYAAQWLRNLISAGLIAPGDVDERSIVDVQPSDLEGYTQCHFFAGIGGWSYAARLAGWPDSRPLWTGSCPCQPFSVAGKQEGQSGERHLWPVFFELIRSCRPDVVMGEQVAAAVGKHWLDGVHSDLESIGYSCGAAVVPACAVDAPHRRDRLWLVADANAGQRDGTDEAICARRNAFDGGSEALAYADAHGRQARSIAPTSVGHGDTPHAEGWKMADTDRRDSFWRSGPLQVGWNCIEGKAEASSQRGRTQWRVDPAFPSWLMGYPPAWVSCAPSAMPLSRKSRRK